MKLIAACLFALIIVVIGTTLETPAQERQMGGVGITVFADANFSGESATYREEVPNLVSLGFNDRISSIRVGPREQWEVCENADYQGRCVVVSGEEPDLRRNSWNDVISSIRRVGSGFPPGPPSQGGPYIVLFSKTNYRGQPRNYNGPMADLYGSNRSAASVTIGRGVWELCDGTNFTGHCVTLDTSVPDLAVYRLRNRVSSARPVRSGGPLPPPSTSDWYIVLFDKTIYRGDPTNYRGEESKIDKRARSVTIGKGVWELCDGRDFTGRCVTLDRSVPDLQTYNLRNRVRSLRPVIRQPR